MIGPAARVPQGLLGYLDIKNDGRFPNNLGETIAPILDISKFISSSAAIEVLTGNASLGATGVLALNYGGSVAGPSQGEFWYLRGFGVYATTGAAELVRYRPCIARQLAAGNQPILIGGEGASSLTDAAAAAQVYAPGPSDIVMSTGDILCVGIERITTAGTIQFNLCGSILRFRP